MPEVALPLASVLAALVALQRAEPVGDEHHMSIAGSAGFVDGRLITARHVLERSLEVHLRFGGSAEPRRLRLETRGADGGRCYSMHPNDAVDLAAMELDPGTTAGLASIPRVALANGALPAGLPVLIAGFHPDVLAAGAPVAVLRRGVIAVAAGAGYGGGHGFLVDAAVVPGMSGSLVLVDRDGGVLVAGLIEGYLPSRRALVDPRSGRPAVLLEESSGFAVALGVEAILATIDAARR